MSSFARRATAAASAAVLVLSVAACGSSGGDKAASSTTKPAASSKTTTTASSTTAAADVTTTTGGGDSVPTAFADTTVATDAAATAKLAKTMLLTPTDLGSTPFTADDISDFTQLCGLDVDKDIPDFATAGTELTDDAGKLSMQEQIRVYATPAKALAAYRSMLKGAVGCSTSTDGSETLDKTADVTEQLQELDRTIDQASSTDVSGSGATGSQIEVVYQDALVIYRFAVGTGADTSKVPSPGDLAAKGIGKIRDGLASS